jgi:hypothetical protein
LNIRLINLLRISQLLRQKEAAMTPEQFLERSNSNTSTAAPSGCREGNRARVPPPRAAFLPRSTGLFQEFAKVFKVRREQLALRRGRQYLREISGNGLDRTEILLAINPDMLAARPHP